MLKLGQNVNKILIARSLSLLALYCFLFITHIIMASRHNIHATEQFLPLENYRSERNRPTELEIFPEEVRAGIIDILEANPEDAKYLSEIEPLDSDEL